MESVGLEKCKVKGEAASSSSKDKKLSNECRCTTVVVEVGVAKRWVCNGWPST